MGVVVLETFAGIIRVSPGHISLGRGALHRSSVCFDVTRGKGEGEWWRWWQHVQCVTERQQL